jgi:hypothetical protein
MCWRNFMTSLSRDLFRASSCFSRSFARVMTRDFEGLVRAGGYQLQLRQMRHWMKIFGSDDLQSEEVSKRYNARSLILSLSLSR